MRDELTAIPFDNETTPASPISSLIRLCFPLFLGFKKTSIHNEVRDELTSSADESKATPEARIEHLINIKIKIKSNTRKKEQKSKLNSVIDELTLRTDNKEPTSQSFAFLSSA